MNKEIKDLTDVFVVSEVMRLCETKGITWEQAERLAEKKRKKMYRKAMEIIIH
ncbi:hypothetical protein KQI86_19225 [Clostridium sp. MSJ-11]|uniref:Uncharacterized protein n=1 Tax=Clostridium mobile TaxID=2841512 RepID=A0ABS6EMH8_9CLOT|nr:hypothetical protein [Clostridium mobile]MBU5486436.1 hypothetical protein [Clostridium mobile]